MALPTVGPRMSHVPILKALLTLDLRCSGGPFSASEDGNRNTEMKAQATKLLAVETDLKQLMADVGRAMAKAEEALARIGGKSVATTAKADTTLQ